MWKIRVPGELVYDKDLTYMEKLVLIVIIDYGEDVSDLELAMEFEVTRSRIRRVVKSLSDKKYIKRRGNTTARTISLRPMMDKYDIEYL